MKKILITFLTLFSFVFIPLGAHAGFGVSPGVIEEDRLVPGIVLERTIYLVQGNQTEDMTIKAVVESPDIAEWITFKNGSEFVIPAGVQQYPMTVIVKIPENAKEDIYNAFIRVSTIPKKVEGSQVTVALGGKVSVKLTVGNDLFSDFIIKSIEILDIKEGEKPQASIVLTNTGNVPVALENASFELFNKYGEIRLAYGENKNFEKVAAFSEGITNLEFPLDVKLGVGEYWGHVKIYNEGKVVKELKTVFNVTPKGFIEKHLYSIAIIAVFFVALLFVLKKKIIRRS